MTLCRQVTDGCFASTTAQGCLSRDDFDPYLARAAEAMAQIQHELEKGGHPFLAAARASDDLPGIEASLAPLLDGDVEDVLILGTGGSILGGWALNALAAPLSGEGSRPRLHFLHSIDPDYWARLLQRLDLARCGLVVISKSGGTAETLAQAMAVLPLLSAAAGKPLTQRALAISEPGDNGLRRLAVEADIPCLDHHPGIGGRFSVLSIVGAIPAVLAGLDMAALREGALACLDACLADEAASAAPVEGAALAAAFPAECGISQLVLMPYNERLEPFGHWYRQLWAESLGKDGKGTTPIRAQGPLDQHSQLQLYLNGPADKYFTLLYAEEKCRGPKVDEALAAAAGADYLIGRSLGDLLSAEAVATAETLLRNGRPVRRMLLERLDEAALGSLFMHFMLETMITAAIIGVDPFGQPAVEEGKVLARHYLKEGPA